MPPHPSDPSLAITSFDKPPHPQLFPRLLASAADMHLAAWAVTTATPAFTRGVRCQDGDPIQNPEEVPSIQSPPRLCNPNTPGRVTALLTSCPSASFAQGCIHVRPLQDKCWVPLFPTSPPSAGHRAGGEPEFNAQSPHERAGCGG